MEDKPALKKPKADDNHSILRSTCDICSKLKRRCGGEKPSCQRCSSVGDECFYSVNVRMASHKSGCSQKLASALGSQTKNSTLACLKCRSRKRKCDQKTPACTPCQNSGSPCSYVLPERRKGASNLKLCSESSGSFGLSDVEAHYLVTFLKTFEELIPCLKWQLYADAGFALAKEAEEMGQHSSLPSCTTALYRVVLSSAIGAGAALLGKMEEAVGTYQQRVAQSLAKCETFLHERNDVADVALLHAFVLYELIGRDGCLQLAALKERLDRGQLIPSVSAAVKLWGLFRSLQSNDETTIKNPAFGGPEHYLTISEWKGYNIRVKNLVVGMLHLERILQREDPPMHSPVKADDLFVRQMRKYLVLAAERSEEGRRSSGEVGEHDTEQEGLSLTCLSARILLSVVDFMCFPDNHAAAVCLCEGLVTSMSQPQFQGDELLTRVTLLWPQLDLLAFMLWLAKKADAYHTLALLRNRFLRYVPGSKPLLPLDWMNWQGHSDQANIQALMLKITAGFQGMQLLPNFQQPTLQHEQMLLQQMLPLENQELQGALKARQQQQQMVLLQMLQQQQQQLLLQAHLKQVQEVGHQQYSTGSEPSAFPLGSGWSRDPSIASALVGLLQSRLPGPASPPAPPLALAAAPPATAPLAAGWPGAEEGGAVLPAAAARLPAVLAGGAGASAGAAALEELARFLRQLPPPPQP